MHSDRILNRILDVYHHSKMSTTSIETESETDKNTQKKPLFSVDGDRLTSSNSMSEIDVNYSLFFNDGYRNFYRNLIKKILQKIAWPVLKRQVYFNVGVKNILRNIIKEKHELLAKINESIVRIGEIEQELDELQSSKQSVTKIIDSMDDKISTRTDTLYKELTSKIEQVNNKIEADRSLANKSVSLQQSRIESNLWFNEAVIVGYRNDEAYWAGTNERIIEKNFVLLSIARLYDSEQLQILDVGAAESLLAYELASLNYSVTAIDLRPISLFHPNLKFVKCDICHPVFSPASFDCVIALSTLEHIGLGWYGDEVGEGLDCLAIDQIYSLLKPGGILILTVPYGKAAVTPVHRIYDRQSLQHLVKNFSILRSAYGIRLDSFTYSVTEDELEASGKEHDRDNYLPGAVAMLVCKKI